MNLRLFCYGPQYSYGCQFAVLAETAEEAQAAIRAYAVRADAAAADRRGSSSDLMQRAAEEALGTPVLLLTRGEVYLTEIS